MSFLQPVKTTKFSMEGVGFVAGFPGEFFLREFPGLAILADVQPEGGKEFVTFRHDS